AGRERQREAEKQRQRNAPASQVLQGRSYRHREACPCNGENHQRLHMGPPCRGRKERRTKQRCRKRPFSPAFSHRLLDPTRVPPNFIDERYVATAGCRKRARRGVSLSFEEKDDVATVAVQLAAAVGLRAFRAGA